MVCSMTNKPVSSRHDSPMEADRSTKLALAIPITVPRDARTEHCRLCGAQPGRSCVTPAGYWTPDHKSRKLRGALIPLEDS